MSGCVEYTSLKVPYSYEIGRRREQPLHGSGGTTRRRLIPTQPPPRKADGGGSAGEVGPSSVDCNAGDVGIKAGEVVSSSVGCKAGDVGTRAGEGVSSSVGSAGKGRSARSERRRDSAMRRRRSWERGDKRRNHSPIAAADSQPQIWTGG